jgi:hypothetical protein
MNPEGRRASGLLEQASAHAAPCAPPGYHQFDFWVGDWDVFDVGSQTNAFGAVRGRARRQSRCFFGRWPQPKHWSAAGLRQTVMTGDTLHLDRRRLSQRQLADVIEVDGCDHLQHDASSLLRILVVGGEVHLELLGVWFFHMAVDTARRSGRTRRCARWTPIVCGRCPSGEPANS